MKKITTLFIFLLSFFLSVAGPSATDPIKTYHEANMAYQKLDFRTSIKLYEELIAEKKISSDIYYNLGNAYFKNGDFAKAILNYERSLKLAPEDEDVIFNLKIASLKVVDRMESVPELFYKKWLTQTATLFSSRNWTIFFIVLVWLLFTSASFYFLGNSVRVKKIFFLVMIVLLFLTATTGIIAAQSHSATYVDEKGIIMSSSVYVKSSPDDKGNDLFILHEGTKVEILDALNSWYKIRIANGGIGWMKTEDLTKI